MTTEHIKELIHKEMDEIPEDHLEELFKIVHDYHQTVKKNTSDKLQELLLLGPVWGEEEMNDIRLLHKDMESWTIQNF